MSMEFCITEKQLRLALKDINHAKRNGFHHCVPVFQFVSASGMIEDCKANYTDLIEKAHPLDDSLNWGRMQYVTHRNRFVNGKLVPLNK